ncbi:MAG: hypothetical protein Q9178_003562 [Gyalolechia marmorata]
MTSTIGIPIKLLNEAQNHVVTLEITSGQVYRGKLIEAEDNMNVQLKDITVTARDGRVSHLDQVYIRGSHVRFFIVPDMLSTTIPIWHETLSPNPAALEEWKSQWLSPEAGEVVQSVGAWVVNIRKPSSGEVHDGEVGGSINGIRETLTTIHDVITHHQETSNKYTTVDSEPLLLLVGMPQPLRPLLEMSNDQWDDLCLDCGKWQWIDSEAEGRNEFGETLGLKQLKEALEANEWDGGDLDAGEIDFEVILGLRERDNSHDGMELERDDVVGSREAILGQHELVEEATEGDAQVEELESMMLKMQAIKDNVPLLRSAPGRQSRHGRQGYSQPKDQ